MFQSYDVSARPEQAAPRLKALRALFPSLGINAMLVPRTDEYQGEYVPPSAERLSWLTGFTGSAGVALVMAETAIVFVDGRYTSQLEMQTDPDLISGGDLVGCPPIAWLKKHKPDNIRVGIDPWLHTPSEVERLQATLHEIGGTLVLLSENPIDGIWDDRPTLSVDPVSVQPQQFAGKPASKKLSEIAATVREKKADAVLISDSTSVAWLFNIRGNDVAHTPAPLARAIVNADSSATLYIAPEKVSGEAKKHLQELAVVEAPQSVSAKLEKLAREGMTIMLDRASVPYAAMQIIDDAGGRTVDVADPVVPARAIKNDGEQAGTRQAHLQDGAAMVSFLKWLDQQDPGSVSEIEAAQALEDARASVGKHMQNPLRDISFDTISGSGPNAAIIHYRVTTDTDRRLQKGELYLVDSGAQYQNGTTDITRTLGIGTVDDQKRRFFTLVLKGMIAISSARFPVGTRGMDLDPLARIALWKAGVDYAHGTGHGVGSYLSVHEGPQRISRLGAPELKPGMIVSNEPGYYRPGDFGIRIENLLLVKEAEAVEGGEIPMLSFETLTWCPIDLRLVMPELMTDDERAWLDHYHAKTRENLMPLVSDEAQQVWLETATKPLSQ